jgi:EAL domain-containing protein (putative c-di-GMP-specific phosphodiesterase class I)
MPEISMENMVRLRMLGFSLAIDDFGVGYSSLERLCQMPFNEIKLDAGFVQNFHQARYSAVIHGALALARELDMRVVAEGIETADQVQHLARLGCQWGQGFFYARPMNWAHLVDWRFEGQKSSWRRAIGTSDR